MSRIESRRRAPGSTSPATGPASGPVSGPVSDPDPSAAPDETPGRAGARTGPRGDAPAASSTRRRLVERLESFGESRWPIVGWAVLVALGLGAMIAAMVPAGPEWLGGVGAVGVSSAFVWALAGRTGGRPVVFGTLAAILGIVVLVSGREDLATGAAVMTCVVTAVLAVMVTVPAVTFAQAARECLLAVLVAGLGALATIGFEPTIKVEDFEYVTFGLALAGILAVVYRLGAGLHGLGRRGVVIVVVGGLLVAVTVLYAELLRRYGTPTLVDSSLDLVRWSRETLGAFPRPIETILGIPALAYGVHMRARRRQGWWVCAFGVAATAAVANSLSNPAIAITESILSAVYGLVVGLAIAFVVIRLDVFLTGSGSTRSSRGRRSRVDEEATAVRPEPRRTQPLH